MPPERQDGPAGAVAEMAVAGYRVVSLLRGEVDGIATYRAVAEEGGGEGTLLLTPPGDPGAGERLMRDAQLLSDLTHPSLPAVQAVGETREGAYAVVEEPRGRSLATALDRGLPTAHALRVLGEVAGALDAAHSAGLLHRRVDPSNVVVGEWLIVNPVLVGFALGRPPEVFDAGAHDEHAPYASPEELRGERAGPGADRYSLACALFEVLAGAPPFGTAPKTAAHGHLDEPAPRLRDLRSDLPQELEAILRRALSKDPPERPAGATELVSLVVRAVSDPAVGLRPDLWESAAAPGGQGARPAVEPRNVVPEASAPPAPHVQPETEADPVPTAPEPASEPAAEAEPAPPAPGAEVEAKPEPEAEPQPATQAEPEPEPASEPEPTPAEDERGTDEIEALAPLEYERRLFDGGRRPLDPEEPPTDAERDEGARAERPTVRAGTFAGPTTAADRPRTLPGARRDPPRAPAAPPRGAAGPGGLSRVGPITLPLGAGLAAIFIAGLAGLLLSRALDGGETPATAPRTATAGALSVQLPEGWRNSPAAPRMGALRLERRLGVAPASGGGLVAGHVGGERASLDPQTVAAQVQRSPPRPATVRLGRLEAYRWQGLRAGAPARRVDLFVAPTSAGALAVACYSRPSGSAPPRGCQSAAGSVRLTGATGYSPLRAARWRESLRLAIDRLRRRREPVLGRLGAATTAQAQAREAGALARLHGTALRDVGAASAPPQAAAAQRRVLDPLRGLERAYRNLDRAARASDLGAYTAASQDVRRQDDRLRRALRSI